MIKTVSIADIMLLALPLVALPQDSALETRNKGNKEKKCSSNWKANLLFVFYIHFIVPMFFSLLPDLTRGPEVLLKLTFPFSSIKPTK